MASTVNSGFGGLVDYHDLRSSLSRSSSLPEQFVCAENEPGLQRRQADENELRKCALQGLSSKLGKKLPPEEESDHDLEVCFGGEWYRWDDSPGSCIPYFKCHTTL